MSKRSWREHLSVLADAIQVASFLGVSAALLVGGVAFLVGALSGVHWFLIAVGGPVAAYFTLLVANRLQGNKDVSHTAEYIAINDVAQELYGKTRGTKLSSIIESVATRNGKLDRDAVLDVCAEYVANTGVKIFGKHPPSQEREELSKDILKSGTFEKGAFHRFGNNEPDFTEISVLAEDKVKALHEIVEDIRSPNPSEEQNFEHGFKKASLQRAPNKHKALRRLTELRGEGVAIRNKSSKLIFSADFDGWSKQVSDWMNEVIEALKHVSPTGSEWFATLDVVPVARVPIPNVRLGGHVDREMFVSTFRQHDYRLARLEKILQKYGIGA